MAETLISEGVLKEALKDALLELLHERRDLFRDLVEDVLMDLEDRDDPLRREEQERGHWVFGAPEGEA